MSERYSFECPGLGLTFIADRLRRDRQELIGELTVKCELAGARTVNGNLLTGDFNFSSVRARQDRAKLLRERAQTDGQFDWFGLLEDFCQRVFECERTGDPAVRLRDLAQPDRGDDIKIDGLSFPRRHPSILFGDGGAAKSLTALYIGGILAQRLPVALFDWELCGDDHRDRYGRLFGSGMPPNLYYRRCERPLVSEIDSLRRIVREHAIEYAIFDSVAFACDGPPEAAEVAAQYFRCVREIGTIGSLHVAHISKAENGDQKPFGSAFWHNGARSTWFVKSVEQTGNDSTLQLGFFNRKANLGPIRPPASYIVTFGPSITFECADISDNQELAGKLTIKQRMVSVLKRGSMTVQEIADEIDERVESVQKSVKRNNKHFIVLAGGRVGLRA